MKGEERNGRGGRYGRRGNEREKGGNGKRKRKLNVVESQKILNRDPVHSIL